MTPPYIYLLHFEIRSTPLIHPEFASSTHPTVCSEFNHVRTWAVTRFRGVISTQPGSIPIASFHVAALDTDSPNLLVDSVLQSLRHYANKGANGAGAAATQEPPRQPTSPAASPHSVGAEVMRTTVSSGGITASAQRSRHHRSNSQTSRFLRWRCGSGTAAAAPSNESAGAVLDYDGAAPVVTTNSAGPPVRFVSDQLDVPSSSPAEHLVHHLNEYSGIVVLPRTSWLHEDPG